VVNFFKKLLIKIVDSMTMSSRTGLLNLGSYLLLYLWVKWKPKKRHIEQGLQQATPPDRARPGLSKTGRKSSWSFRTRFLWPLIECFFLISLSRLTSRLPGEISGFFTGYVHVYTTNWYLAGTWWCRYRLQVSSRFPRFSSAHKNLVRKVQALLRPVLESPAHRLSDGIPCWLVSSSLLVKYLF